MNAAKIHAAFARRQVPAPPGIFARKGEVVSLHLYGDITDETVTAAVKGLAEPAREVRLYVNSAGGSVFAAKAIMAAIARKVAGGTPVIGVVDGVAASAASFLLMACTRVEMHAEAQMVIHLPHGIVAGSATDFREMADVLDTETESLIRIYCQKTGMTPEKMRTLLETETWMGAKEAVALRFADAVVGEPGPVAASIESKFLAAAADTQRRLYEVALATVEAVRIKTRAASGPK